jgi:hypothetical protein
MAMFKGSRARERIFLVLMWLVSIVLAGFLIGLGSLVIGDLPKVSDPVAVEDFMDSRRLAAIDAEQAGVQASLPSAQTRLADAESALGRARSAYVSQRETFDNWILTRAATESGAQNPEVLARTRELDRLKAVERGAQVTREAAQAEVTRLERASQASMTAEDTLRTAAMPAFERASFMQELKVFALRLALTLPLLLIALWMLLKGRGGDYWPMKRGFILFAAFAFFVELVPYLPDYGGYVRYAVGIAITLVVGHYVIRWMRAYLAAREADESRAEPERVRSIAYDEALKKKAAGACPGCERSLPTTEGTPIDYCVHCGMHLFNHCPSCSTRKFAFFRYCMTCGTPAAPEAQA